MKPGLRLVENTVILARGDLSFLAAKARRKQSVRSITWERGFLVLLLSELRVLSPHVPLNAVSELITNYLIITGYTSVGSVRPFPMYIIVAQGQCSKCTLKRSPNELFWSTLVQECPLLSCLWVLSLWDDSVNYQSGLLNLNSWLCSLLFFLECRYYYMLNTEPPA